MTNTYVRHTCPLCGQIISANGLSQNSHMAMHVREGYYTVEHSFTHGKSYHRTDLPFDREAYQKAHPERAYNYEDYFPITGHPKDAKLRRKHYAEMVKRKRETGR